MSQIVVEDGTQLDEASPLPNSYVSTDELTTYAAARGLTDISESDEEQKCIALIKAADYLGQKYRLWWKGSRIKAFQPLDWPRRGVDVPDFFDPFFKQTNVPINFQDTLFVPENEVPQEVKDGQMQLAIATYSGNTASGVLQAALGRVTKREKLGQLEVEYFNAEDGSTRQTTKYWDAEQRIQPFLLPNQPFGGTVIRS